tara:strand:+ start:1354 stop:2451 length:1098 start_codon:yes stop_codon:yes gene_type:complete
MLVRLAPRVILVYALHLLLLTVTVSAQYIGNADPEKRADRRENRRDARSTRTRYRSSRTNRYRGRDRRLAARRLLQAADSPAWAPVGASSPDDDAYFAKAPNWPFPNDEVPDEETGECLTLLEIIDTHPDLSLLSNVTSTLPIVRQALGARDSQDTFFAPNNDAINGLRDWAGFEEFEDALVALLGDINTAKGVLLAYHAVPDVALTVDDLLALIGDDRYLEDALEAEMPLFVDNADGDVTIIGLGSKTKLVGSEIVACNGVLHMVQHCLLPFDGDNKLDIAQKQRLVDAKRALELRYPDRPTLIDPDAYDDDDDDDDDDSDDNADDSDDEDSDSDDSDDDADDSDDEDLDSDSDDSGDEDRAEP